MTAAQIRRAAVAGTFYSDDPVELAAGIDAMLLTASPSCAGEPDDGHDVMPTAIIVPHAGHAYSGPIAATAYAQLRRWRDQITRVIVMGPPHRVAVRGVAVSSAAAFATPLGIIDVDIEAVTTLRHHRSVYVDDAAHGPEHSIEVHLPFLQRVLAEQWRLVALLVGGVPTSVVADALSELWAAPGTLVVVSTDLSHYHDVRTAQQLDRATAARIVGRSWEQLHGSDACGAAPVRAALELCRRSDARVELLDLRTSADTAGSPDHVVGYGSFVVR